MKFNLKFNEKNLQESNLVNIMHHLKSIEAHQSPTMHSKKSKLKTNGTDDASSKHRMLFERQKKRNSASFSKASDGAMNRSQGSDKMPRIQEDPHKEENEETKYDKLEGFTGQVDSQFMSHAETLYEYTLRGQ